MLPDHSKDSLRERVRSDRSTLSQAGWEREDAARTAAVMAALPTDAGVVAAYASRPGEPGTTTLLDALVTSGRRVLLPAIGREPDWAWFTGADAVAVGWGGIPQPTGPGLGAVALWMADLVLVPCLAVARDGARLGTGGGWYDRALPHRRDAVPAWALARAVEVWDSLPAEPHDIAVDAVVTEHGILRQAQDSVPSTSSGQRPPAGS